MTARAQAPVEWEVDAVLPAAMPDGRSRPRGGCRCSADRLLPLMYEGANGSEVLRSELAVTSDRDRDAGGRPRQVRPRDALGRPLPYGAGGVEPVSEEPLPPSQTVDMARSLVREGRPFAAHEVLEARWKAGPDAERDLWQGLAQICVGLTHGARGNSVGAERLLQRGADRLVEYDAGNGSTYGLDLTAVIACARKQMVTGH